MALFFSVSLIIGYIINSRSKMINADNAENKELNSLATGTHQQFDLLCTSLSFIENIKSAHICLRFVSILMVRAWEWWNFGQFYIVDDNPFPFHFWCVNRKLIRSWLVEWKKTVKCIQRFRKLKLLFFELSGKAHVKASLGTSLSAFYALARYLEKSPR